MKTIPAFFIKFEATTCKTPKTIAYAHNLLCTGKDLFACFPGHFDANSSFPPALTILKTISAGFY